MMYNSRQNQTSLTLHGLYFALSKTFLQDQPAIHSCVFQNEDIERRVIDFLAENDLTIDDIDLVITGKSGDTAHDDIYEQLNQSLFKGNNLGNYKHLCGEYPTSSAFALWLASNIIKTGIVPDAVVERHTKAGAPKRILTYNHYQKIYHSLMLVSAI